LQYQFIDKMVRIGTCFLSSTSNSPGSVDPCAMTIYPAEKFLAGTIGKITPGF
jgi:hypothetical protein